MQVSIVWPTRDLLVAPNAGAISPLSARLTQPLGQPDLSQLS
jgi:hypothetical protein